MRKIFSYIIAGLALLSASACVHEQPAIFDPSSGTAPVLHNYVVDENGVSAEFTPGSVKMGFNENVPPYHSLAIVELDGAKANKVIPANIADNKISVSKANLSKIIIGMGKPEGVTVSMKLTVRMSLQDPTKDSGLNGFIDSKDQISISSWLVEVPQPQGNPWKDLTEKSTWSVIGSIASTGNSWNKDEPMFTDGTKHVAKNIKFATDDQFKIRNNGGWDDNRGAAGDVEPFVISIGEPLEATPNGKNLAVPAEGYYDLLYDSATETITITEAFQTYPGFESVSEWSVIGAIASFEMEWNKDIEMSTDGTWHVAEGVELKASDQFKFRKNQDWGDNFGATGDVEPFVVTLDTEYEASPGGKNLAVPEDGVYDLLVNPDAKLFKIVATLGGSCHLVGEGGGETPVDPDTPVVEENKWSLIGKIEDSEWNKDFYMTESDGVWTSPAVSFAAGAEFKLRFNNSWADADCVGAAEEGFNPTPGVAFKGEHPGKNIIIKDEGVYQVEFKPEAMEITVFSMSNRYSLIGSVDGTSWNKDFFMDKLEGGLWKIGPVKIGGEFKIRYNMSWADADCYGAPADFTPTVGQAFTAVQPGSNITVAEGNYFVTFNENDKSVLIEDAVPGNLWAVIGSVNGTAWNKDFYMTEDAGVWVSEELEFAADAEFKLRFNNSWADPDCFGGAENGIQLAPGVPVTPVHPGNNLKVAAPGKYHVVYDSNKGIIFLQGWALIGAIEGSMWNKDFFMTANENGVWTSDEVTIKGEFKLRNNSSWADPDTRGYGEGGFTFTPGQVFKVASPGNNINVPAEGKYVVTYTPATEEVVITAAGGEAPKATIADFAKEYVKILDVWEQNVGKVNRLSVWEPAKDGDEDVVENVHYIPNNTTITVAGKSYTIGDMLETALRSYLLLRGWDGNETEKAGLGNIPTAAPVSMSETAVPETHGFMFNKPLIESSNGGYLVKIVGEQEIHCQVDPLILDNWAQRSLNWPFTHDMLITNFCGYPRDPITNYSGCFSSGRALITYAFFFKYLLDNQLDRADALPNSTVIRSELFGNEGGQGGDSNVIKTAEEMIAFLADPTKDVELGANIDLSGANVTPAAEVTGNFDGKGHLITVKLQTPLFLVTRGDVKNVTFAGSFAATAGAEKTVLAPIGKSYGAIENVTNKASVTLSGPAGQGGADTANGAIVAGVVGEAYGPVKGCSNTAKIAADASGKDTWTIIVAGVAGVVGDAVEGCANSGEVSLVAGSPLGRTKGLTEVTMKYDPVSSVAGIVTYAVSDANHTVTVTNCENTGKISFTYDALHDKSAAVSRSPVAGIVANSGGDITNCHNKGDIYATMVAPDRSAAYADVNIILHAAGVQGADYFVKKIKSTVDQNETSVINCSNTGNIYADSDMTKSNNTIGGVSAWPSAESASVTVIKDCVNSGNLTIKGKMKIRAGGIAGGTNSIEGCTNSGNILVEGADASSVFGLINGFHTQTHTLKNCQTTGTLESKIKVNGLGGLCGGIGNVENTLGEGCKVNATIIGGGSEQCGLIVGHLNGNSKKVTIGTTESPVTVAGTVEGVKATAENYTTLLHKATNYTEGIHVFNVVYGE